MPLLITRRMNLDELMLYCPSIQLTMIQGEIWQIQPMIHRDFLIKQNRQQFCELIGTFLRKYLYKNISIGDVFHLKIFHR